MQNGLVLSRHENEEVVIDLRKWGLGELRVTVAEIRNGKVRLHFAGDRQIPIDRAEVFEAKEKVA